ncbi:MULTISPECIES: nicotinate phosphoribosyltransferase [Desulfococcus]|uniref:Nicotinate phosphoribosyltransferase n=1 Tax=Desulfococcus multivorans DSM 2059 TaxID=1121405 RepID=S7U1T5_DESML|nr:PncB2: Nicotinate phosphoribosyltransferase (NAPRTase) [Desulfococcus multivorans]AQV01140.1 nicotinate phosphoribosyltransferase [Desulfococcus multivorans]EPR42980.1 Nicotinate phosphoribosyltransferase [Desulfococcus multivorans DSM 2059]SJZ51833.1 nicotinate phosphoribosyltransferase [Desulfococcus multivorans DSM 2059]
MIINSLLDTDLYKLTMMQGVLHQFPWAEVEYEFNCRDDSIDLSPVVDTVAAEIDHLCTLRFTPEELNYLGDLRFLKKDFIQFLRLFHLQRDYIHVKSEDGKFKLGIKGPWLHTILFEVPVLAIVNEVYFSNIVPHPNFDTGRGKLFDKIALVKAANAENLGFSFSDFGTRRRFSRAWQEHIIAVLKKALPRNFIGTSNVYFARKFDLTPIGTMAHEWIMAAQALGPRLVDSQKFALEHWAQEYRGDLGIALSDTVGFEAFLSDFDMYFAKLFDGCRHDSGDPFHWGDRLIAHYRRLKVSPQIKRAIFSDGLSFDKAIELARYFNGRIQTAFGIGTNLTNDITEKPVQIVIKMIRCQGAPVAKISDTPGKQMCKDAEYLSYLKSVFKRKVAAGGLP